MHLALVPNTIGPDLDLDTFFSSQPISNIRDELLLMRAMAWDYVDGSDYVLDLFNVTVVARNRSLMMNTREDTTASKKMIPMIPSTSPHLQ